MSAFMDSIIARGLNERTDSKNTVTYDFMTGSTHTDGDVAVASLKFKHPVDEAYLRDNSEVLKYIQEGMENAQLGIVDAILAQYGLRDKVGKKRSKGKVNVNFGLFDNESSTGAVNTQGGKLISQTNLRSLLTIVGKNYLIRDMKRPNAPLKFRSGRFANSMKVTGVKVDAPKGNKVKPEMSIFYTFMTHPYATFDPHRSTQPAMYMRPSYGARNPQTHIGDALSKAARDIIHNRYRLNVKEARQ